MPQYYPFHFVPASGKSNKFTGLEFTVDQLKKGGGYVTHERYVPGTLSGLLECTLTTVTPLVVGAEQSRPNGQLAHVEPFLIDRQPAIPGSSLRGMLSAILEAVSDSALRILDSKPYELRVPVPGQGNLTVRQAVPGANGQPATAWDFFAALDRRLLPLHPERTQRLSVAELILGVVSENPKSEKKTGFALASRVRISDALPVPGQTDLLAERLPLRILSSPKASEVDAPASRLPEVASPCPVLYMKNASGAAGYIAKESLKPGIHVPQGRKFYLHHSVTPGQTPWRTEVRGNDLSAKQKNSVQPIAARKTFVFTVQFDNLHPAELALLLYALKPTEKFRHKLGMGKPLGLGSVELAIQEQAEVQRQKRYTLEGLSRGRSVKPNWFPGLRKMIEDNAPPEILQALQALGEQIPPDGQVRYPLAAGQTDPEGETFKWFVLNQRSRAKWLHPIAHNNGDLPPLD